MIRMPKNRPSTTSKSTSQCMRSMRSMRRNRTSQASLRPMEGNAYGEARLSDETIRHHPSTM
ncbi:hypothetical protein WM40_03945 [Robbsia andropogonis]|uniref:Uncharacterized protein n=1 Tax=Robbsia andropogonis TaxID=28092 RepID=A0A0F5K411_9BURK|nr:hypothetical protein WM40_03945 [Robbsia andropogonis]